MSQSQTGAGAQPALFLSPSVLACDFARLGEEAAAMEQAGADMLHLDIMDGHFVPNISFGPPVVASLRKATGLELDLHLMMTHPLRYAEDFARAGAGRVSFHVESEDDPVETLRELRRLGISPGLVLKPRTPAEAVFPLLEQVDMVLVMTVEPGFGGQGFRPDMLPKVAQIRRQMKELGLEMMLQVDGGISNETAPLAVSHGANNLVAGSSLFSRENYGQALAELREAGRSGLFSPVW